MITMHCFTGIGTVLLTLLVFPPDCSATGGLPRDPTAPGWQEDPSAPGWQEDLSTECCDDVTPADVFYDQPGPSCSVGEGLCISLCCPEFEVRMVDKTWRPHRCQPDEEPPNVCARLQEEKTKEINFKTYYDKGKEFRLVSPSARFSCPTDKKYSLIRADFFYQNFSLTENGRLIGSYPMSNGSWAVYNHSSPSFCLVYAETMIEANRSGVEDSFMICVEEGEDRPGEKFTMIFYPTALLISSLFLLLTILSYILDPDLHRPLFGKITLGFVINLLFSYLCLAGGYISKNLSSGLSLMSLPCTMLGYLTLYTFFSFMFWINAMAASICFKFSSILSANTENEKKKFILNFLYAQGLPLLLCIIVYTVDSFGPCDWTRPNMGVSQCFIGTPWMEQDSNVRYFKTSEFMYFQVILLTLQIANIIFFLVTVSFLLDHWRKASTLTKTGENRGNFLIVVKLFFIMGIPWLGEFLSHTITHEHGPDSSGSTFKYRIAIDCLNLFTGVLVFLVLVCKRKTVQRVRSRLNNTTNTGHLSRGSTMTTSARDHVNWSTVSQGQHHRNNQHLSTWSRNKSSWSSSHHKGGLRDGERNQHESFIERSELPSLSDTQF